MENIKSFSVSSVFSCSIFSICVPTKVWYYGMCVAPRRLFFESVQWGRREGGSTKQKVDGDAGIADPLRTGPWRASGGCETKFFKRFVSVRKTIRVVYEFVYKRMACRRKRRCRARTPRLGGLS
jgi:hypothetical protein